MMKATKLTVRMAFSEWASNTNMGAIAREQFELHPQIENLLVEVVEHGWHLSFAMLDGEMMVVGSANGWATYSPRQSDFRELLNGAEWDYLPTVVRDEVLSLH